MLRVIKSILILSLVMLFPAIACNLQEAPTTAPTEAVVQPQASPTAKAEEEQPATQPTAESFLDESYSPKDASKIILISVEPDDEGNIQTVSFLLPDTLKDAEIVANGVKVDPTVEDQVFLLDLAGKVDSPEVELLFKSGDQTLATCKVNAAALLNPSGDCIW